MKFRQSISFNLLKEKCTKSSLRAEINWGIKNQMENFKMNLFFGSKGTDSILWLFLALFKVTDISKNILDL